MKFYKIVLASLAVIAVCSSCQSESQTKVKEPTALIEAEKTKAQIKIEAEAELARVQAQIAEMAKEQIAAEQQVLTEEKKAEIKVEVKAPPEEKPKETIEIKAPEVKVPAEVPDPAKAVAVTINGVDITEADINVRIKPEIEMLAAQNKQRPPQIMEQYKARYRPQIIDIMIVEYLIKEKAKAADITISNEQVIEQIKEAGAEKQPPLSLDEIKTLIEAQGRSFDSVKNTVKKQLTFRKLVEDQGVEKIEATEQQAQQYYNEQIKQFEMPEQVKASHILIKANKRDPNDVRAAAKAKAQDLRKQILDGADFAALAKEHSQDPGSAKNGGNLNYFKRGRMAPPFDKAAFELEVGKVSELVETDYGYHIIKVTDHKQPSVTTFAEAKEKIMAELKADKQEKLVRDYIDSLKAEATIVYPPGKEPKARRPARPRSARPRPR